MSWLRNRRKLAGYATQAALAHAVGVSEKTVGEMERGRSAGGHRSVRLAVADKVGVPIEELERHLAANTPRPLPGDRYVKVPGALYRAAEELGKAKDRPQAAHEWIVSAIETAVKVEGGEGVYLRVAAKERDANP